MAIFLDTNILPNRDQLLDNVVVAAVLEIGKIKRIPVALSAVVVDESVNMRLEAATEAFARLNKAHRDASRFFELDAIYIPSAVEAAEEWRRELQENFVVVAMNDSDSTEALRREALRVPPANKGKGSRDSAIWLTALRHHKDTGGPTYFVSANTSDFGTPKTTELHPSLLAELEENVANFHFFTRVEDLLEYFGEKITCTVEPDQISSFAQQVFESASPQIEVAGLLSAEFTDIDEISLSHISIAPIRHAYKLDEVTLARLSFEATLSYSILEPADLVIGLPIKADTWIQIDNESGQPTALNVISTLLKLDASELSD